MENTQLARLIVSLEAKVDKYEKSIEKARGNTNKSFATMKRSAMDFERTLSGVGRSLAGAFVGVAGIRGAVQLIETSTRMTNALKVTGLAGEDLKKVYAGLRDAALRNAAPLESLIQLYSRASLVQNELGVSTEDLMKFSDNVALALRVSGQSASEASGALLQLSQALGSGVVRAEEFNSMLEGAPTILQAAAAGIKEAEGSVAKLRAIMLEGKLSSRALFDGIQVGSAMLEQKVSSSTLTVSQAMENLHTRLIDVAMQFNSNTNASALMTGEIENLGKGIEDLATFLNNIIPPLQTFLAGLEDGIVKARSLAFEIAKITGLDQAGFNIAVTANNMGLGDALSVGSSAAGRVVDQTFALIGATPQDEALAAILAGNAPPDPVKITVDGANPISINDPAYKPTSTSTGTGKGGARSDRFADSLADYQRRVDLLNAETMAQRALNPLVNDYGYSVEKARAAQELEAAAKRANIALGPEQRAQIEQMATAYAQATADANRLAEAQDAQVAAFTEIRDAARSALETIVNGFIEGKDAGEIFANVLKNIGNHFLQMGLNGLFGGGSTPGFGIFGRLFGFAEGGKVSGPGTGTSDSIPAMLSNGEFVVNSRSAGKHAALLEAINEDRLTQSGVLAKFASGGPVGRPMPRLPSGESGAEFVLEAA